MPAFILHDKPGMLQGNELFKKAIFPVEPGQEFLILSSTKAKAYICIDSKGHKLSEALDHKSLYSINQVFTIIIVVVRLPPIRIH